MTNAEVIQALKEIDVQLAKLENEFRALSPPHKFIWTARAMIEGAWLRIERDEAGQTRLPLDELSEARQERF